ncbi:MAG: hypothetical protein SGCHY_002523 [Lobulomycetales sp.]
MEDEDPELLAELQALVEDAEAAKVTAGVDPLAEVPESFDDQELLNDESLLAELALLSVSDNVTQSVSHPPAASHSDNVHRPPLKPPLDEDASDVDELKGLMDWDYPSTPAKKDQTTQSLVNKLDTDTRTDSAPETFAEASPTKASLVTELKDTPVTEPEDTPVTEPKDTPVTELEDTPVTELEDTPVTKGTELQDAPILSEAKTRPASAKSDGSNHRSPAASEIPFVKVVQQRQGEYKALALYYKKKGKLPEARALLAVGKTMQETIDTLSSGGPVSPGWALPPPPSSVSLDTLVDQRQKTTNKQAKMPGKELAESLDTQIKLCLKLAAYHLGAARKEQALYMHKIKKQLAHEQLNIKNQDTVDRPTYTKFVYELTHDNSDLPLDKLEFSLKSISLAADRPAHLGIELSILEQVFSYSMDPNTIQWTQMVDYTRNRALQRMVERKRVSLVFSRPKTGLISGLLGRMEPYARCAFKLDALLKNCEISQSMDLFAMNSRKVLGSVEILIRTRKSLVPSAASIISIERFYTPGFDMGESVSVLDGGIKVVPRKNAPAPVHKAGPPSIAETVAAKPVLDTPLAAAAKPEVDTPLAAVAKPVVDTTDLELKFENPDEIVSNHVLETEHAEVLTRLSKSPGSMELKELSEGYALRKSVLISLVSSGALSLEGYLNGLEKAVQETRRMAAEFKAAGNLDYARRSLKRCKLMQEEISNMTNG